MNINFFIDHRERRIIDEFKIAFSKPNVMKNRGVIDYSVDTLQAGDYIICDQTNRVLCAIERKTLRDYADSLVDGRHDNIEKLLKLREETNCEIYYLVEGSIDPSYSTVIRGRISYKNIASSIRHLEIRDNIHIIRTKTPTHTAKELRFLCEVYSDLASRDTFREIKGSSLAEVSKNCEVSEETKLKNNIYAAWSSIKGIGKSAYILAEKYSIYDVLVHNLPGLDDIKINNRSLSKTVKELLKSDLNEVQQKLILSSIPGVSKISAGKIASNFHLIDFFDQSKKNEIINFQLTERKKLGNAIYSKVVEIISSKVNDLETPQTKEE